MSTNLVIVALPADDDPVRKVSSEKEPHLTILFLGDASNNPKINDIFQFVQHAVTICEHGPFYLDVDHRGVLGEDKADVLFFRKGWNIKWLSQFRSQLLQNDNIRTAYDSTEQFPEWTPHLTLGYPDTPANEDELPDHGFYGVRFDRIAVWTGNYEGPEFRLEWAERDDELMVAYSDTGQALVEDVLHYGTKGMQWGVRKQQIKSGTKALVRFAGDVSFENRAVDGRARSMIISEAKSEFKRNDLSKINAKAEYQDAKKLKTRLRNPSDPIVKQYRKEHREAYIKQLEKTANSMTNASKDREYTIRERGVELPAKGGDLPTSKYFWDVSSRPRGAAAHADNFDGITSLEIILDEDGFIIDLVEEKTTVEHGAVFAEGLLDGMAHYGIKGMQWGVRKPPPVPIAPQASSKVPHGAKRKTKIEVEGGENHPAAEDAIKVAQARAKLAKSGPAALSNKELQDIASRVELEQRVKRATQPGAQKFISNLLRQQGQETSRQLVREQVKKKVATA